MVSIMKIIDRKMRIAVASFNEGYDDSLELPGVGVGGGAVGGSRRLRGPI